MSRGLQLRQVQLNVSRKEVPGEVYQYGHVNGLPRCPSCLFPSPFLVFHPRTGSPVFIDGVDNWILYAATAVCIVVLIVTVTVVCKSLSLLQASGCYGGSL